jgi:hypothetical protein
VEAQASARFLRIVYCADTNTLTTYGTGTETITTTGECTSKLTTPFSGVVDCTGYYTTKYIGAPSSGGNNILNWYPYNRQIVAPISILLAPLSCEDIAQPPKYTSCIAHICVTKHSVLNNCA